MLVIILFAFNIDNSRSTQTLSHTSAHFLNFSFVKNKQTNNERYHLTK